MYSLNDEQVRKINVAKTWMGFSLESEIDICEDGSVYVGLTKILPKDSINIPKEEFLDSSHENN